VSGSRRALVVHAHPDPASYSASLRDRAVHGLEQAGWSVDVIDLYACEFRTAMSTEERRAYHEPEPILDDQVRAHADLVGSAEAIVFVYPTWWWGQPAVLKGWFERVLVNGVAFTIDDQHRLHPAMRHVRQLVGISTYGSTWWRIKAVGDAGRRVITRTVRINIGWRCRTRWLALYAVDTADDARRQSFADRVEHAMAAL
jgi:putative NADPH-quinone reductase